jgi:hypothetical protein
MLATVHLLVGAAVGLYTGNPIWAFAAGFASHFFLDAIPHTDPATLKHKPDRGRFTLTDYVLAFLDVTIGAALLFWVLFAYVAQPPAPSLFWGALGGVSPDFVATGFKWIPGLQKNSILSWYYKFDRAVQNTAGKSEWDFGIVTQVLAAVVALFFLGR